MFTQSNYMNIN